MPNVVSLIKTTPRIAIPLALFFLVTTFVIFTSNERYDIIHRLAGGAPVPDGFASRVESDGSDWVGDFAAVRAVCDDPAKSWHQGVILMCEPAAEGVAEVRNWHLSCIRMAIEARVELILPRIVRRPFKKKLAQPQLKSKGPVKGESLDYFFDKHHLTQSLSLACPQLKIYDSLDDLWNVPTLLNPINFHIHDVSTNLEGGMVLEEPKNFTGEFSAWLDTAAPPEKRQMPLRVFFENTGGHWPIAADTWDFRRQFGSLLRVRPDARRMAATVLHRMGTRFGFDLADEIGSDRQDTPRQHAKRATTTRGIHGFAAVDLRTTADQTPNRYPTYLGQEANYIGYLNNSGISAVYLPKGGARAEDEGRFMRRAAGLLPHKMDTVTRDELLDQQDLRVLDSRFTWDQRFLVDYEVMRRATRLLGPSESDFALDLAVRRHYRYEARVAERAEATAASTTTNSSSSSSSSVDYVSGAASNSSIVAKPKEAPGRAAQDGQQVGGVMLWQDGVSMVYGSTSKRERLRSTVWP